MSDEDRSLSAKVERLARRRAKCKFCGVEFEGLYDTHLATSHPDYVEWGRRFRRWMRFVASSDVALFLLYALYLRSLNQNFQYVFEGYLLASLFLLIGKLATKQLAYRDAWKKTHPQPNKQRPTDG